jgi:hypothetical protein
VLNDLRARLVPSVPVHAASFGLLKDEGQLHRKKRVFGFGLT